MSASLQDNRLTALHERFAKEFGGEPQIVVRAPGRVNLIGEHTDYNDGLVFPVAIDREIIIAARATDDDFIEIYSEDYQQKDRFSIADIIKTEEKPWSNYVRGTAAVLLKQGYKFGGFQAVSTGNVPQGAGLSSSAAYEVAVCYLISTLSNLSLTKKQMALFAQEAENNFVGVNCGIMDQFISAFGETDSGLLIDCRTLDYKSIPLNLKGRELALVIVHSGVQRGLVDSKYNERRSQCAEGVQLLAKHLKREVKSLREIEELELDECAMALPEIIFRRCRHVITENARVSATVEAFETGDLARVGKLLEASHQSLRQDFEVSCEPVDILVDLTANYPGVTGARMTGGGFGGCIVALMEKAAVPGYTASVPVEYLKQTGLTATVYDCQAAAGASTV